jgi:hypothetical protein
MRPVQLTAPLERPAALEPRRPVEHDVRARTRPVEKRVEALQLAAVRAHGVEHPADAVRHDAHHAPRSVS